MLQLFMFQDDLRVACKHASVTATHFMFGNVFTQLLLSLPPSVAALAEKLSLINNILIVYIAFYKITRLYKINSTE